MLGPLAGMHPRDTARLLEILHRLRDAGNTVVVVEHDLAMIAKADYVVDLGPGAGEEGGELVYQGPAAGLALLDGLAGQLGDHHRLHSVRAHLLEQAGDTSGAIAEFEAAAARTTNLRERDYLVTKAARLAAGPSPGAGRDGQEGSVPVPGPASPVS